MVIKLSLQEPQVTSVPVNVYGNTTPCDANLLCHAFQLALEKMTNTFPKIQIFPSKGSSVYHAISIIAPYKSYVRHEHQTQSISAATLASPTTAVFFHYHMKM